ncbi:MAG TPA: sulfotransferase [Pseudomonadota bacterium]|nr:sulfotransferase [Pseudomonadota bacterium]
MTLASEPTGSLEQALAHAGRLLATDPALAAAQASEILKVVRNHPQATLLLGASHTARGDSQGAVQILAPLAASHPNWARAHLELGLALGRAGRGEQAVAALQRAVALNPELPSAWRALGDHRAAMGDSAGADAAYANHIRYSTRDPALLTAATALCENRIPEAEALLRAHLLKAPTDVAAIRMLAEVAARLGRHEDAETLLARCLELAPSFHAARQNYALVLYRGNKPEQALVELESLLATDAANPSYRNLKAVVLGRIGDYEPAMALFAGLLEEYPGNAKIWLSYGHTLKTAGKQDAAIAAYRKCIALDPCFGEAYWSLANLKTFRFDADDVAAMQRQLAREGLDVAHRYHFEFSLGKALEDARDYAASFSHYERGNTLRLEVVPYNHAPTSNRLRRAREVFTRDFYAQRAGYGADAADPIFIVGLPRSGSTLLEQILSSHSAVEGTMELPEIISMTRGLRRQAGPGPNATYYDVLATLDADAVRELGEQYIERTRIQRKTPAPYFIDKMPNNFVHVGLIHLALPNARIIDARRHPLACCFSCYKQHFARGQNFTYSLEDVGHYYADYVALMAHFDEVLPGRVHRVIYEHMVEDTEAEVRRLLDYCGLPFEDGCMRFFENDRPVRTASSEQVRKPIYRDGIDHWRHYEPWLGPLKTALGPVLEAYPAAPEHAGSGQA